MKVYTFYLDIEDRKNNLPPVVIASVIPSASYMYIIWNLINLLFI